MMDSTTSWEKADFLHATIKSYWQFIGMLVFLIIFLIIATIAFSRAANDNIGFSVISGSLAIIFLLFLIPLYLKIRSWKRLLKYFKENKILYKIFEIPYDNVEHSINDILHDPRYSDVRLNPEINKKYHFDCCWNFQCNSISNMILTGYWEGPEDNDDFVVYVFIGPNIEENVSNIKRLSSQIERSFSSVTMLLP